MMTWYGKSVCFLQPQLYIILVFWALLFGGDEKRSGYVRYIQGVQHNVPAPATFIDIYPV